MPQTSARIAQTAANRWVGYGSQALPYLLITNHSESKHYGMTVTATSATTGVVSDQPWATAVIEMRMLPGYGKFVRLRANYHHTIAGHRWPDEVLIGLGSAAWQVVLLAVKRKSSTEH